MSLLTRVLSEIEPLDSDAMDAARADLARVGAPVEASGHLGILALQLAGLQGRPRLISPDKKNLLLCAGDHGLVPGQARTRTPTPTQGRIVRILERMAPVNMVAEQVGAAIHVIDAGIAADMDLHPDLTIEKAGRGTDDATVGPAMSLMQAVMAIETGIRVGQQAAAQGVEIMGLAGMGLGSVTSAAMVIATISGRAVAELVPEARSEHRDERARAIAAAEQALSVNRPEQYDMLDILSKVGGFEIGAIAGIALSAAARRIPVVVDGLVAAAGALLAAGLSAPAQGALIAGHRSAGEGHRVALQMLRIRPCLAMALPVDGGIGALLAMPLVEAAAGLWAGVASRAR